MLPFVGSAAATEMSPETSFILSATSGDLGAVDRALHANGSPMLPNTADVFGNPVLVYAVKANREDVVKMLINAGALIDAKDENGRTALTWAVLKGHKKILEFLLTKGADPLEQDPQGWTPLRYAELYNKPFVEPLKQHSRTPVDDEDAKRALQVIIAGAIGGLLFPLLEFLEVRHRANTGRLITYAMILPIIGMIIVYAVSQSDVKLNPLIGLQIGFCGPTILRAWRNKPLTAKVLGGLEGEPPQQGNPS
ncbi:MAG TPA: ankyrin repeat domain-containing protein [Thermoanaerobaculia bacterium]|nr:ankyrin repeat domain-containing protein [Thermoanaerobaculia bacterium]